MRSFLALLLVAPLMGCVAPSASLLLVEDSRDLLIHSEDSRLAKAGKVAARIPFAILTVGISETAYSCVRDTEPPLQWDGKYAVGGTWLGPAAKWTRLTPAARWAHLTPEARISECIEGLASSDVAYHAPTRQGVNQVGCGNSFQDAFTNPSNPLPRCVSLRLRDFEALRLGF